MTQFIMRARLGGRVVHRNGLSVSLSVNLPHMHHIIWERKGLKSSKLTERLSVSLSACQPA